MDDRTKGQKDKRTKGQKDDRTKGQKDKRQKDKSKKDKRIKGQWDKGSRSQRDKRAKSFLQQKIQNIFEVLCCISGMSTFSFFVISVGVWQSRDIDLY